ncbi:hypothetical protein GW17_00034629 [Ensete ventricosum]|nr:hypothetical protein GW17_00034629 [Ensete ventricosum]
MYHNTIHLHCDWMQLATPPVGGIRVVQISVTDSPPEEFTVFFDHMIYSPIAAGGNPEVQRHPPASEKCVSLHTHLLNSLDDAHCFPSLRCIRTALPTCSPPPVSLCIVVGTADDASVICTACRS